MKKRFKIIVSVLIIFVNVSCDQITKQKVRKEIAAHTKINIISTNFILTKVENTGAALSLGENLSPMLKKIVLQFLPILVLLLLFVHIVKEKKLKKSHLIAFSCIIGGGLGNIYDRILYNSVTDFMYIEVGIFHTGVFNMADLSVFVGVIIMLLATVQWPMKKTEQGKTESY